MSSARLASEMRSLVPWKRERSPVGDREDGVEMTSLWKPENGFHRDLDISLARFPHSHNRSPSHLTGTKKNRTAINRHSVAIAAPVRW